MCDAIRFFSELAVPAPAELVGRWDGKFIGRPGLVRMAQAMTVPTYGWCGKEITDSENLRKLGPPTWGRQGVRRREDVCRVVPVRRPASRHRELRRDGAIPSFPRQERDALAFARHGNPRSPDHPHRRTALHRSVSLSPQTITAITAAGREPDAGIAQWPAAVAAMPSVAARRARSVPLAGLSRAFVADPEILVPGGKARARQLGRRSRTQPAPPTGNLQQTIDESLTAVGPTRYAVQSP